MSNELYYICSQCGTYTQRIPTKDNYFHPCTKCNSPKLIQTDINIWQQRRMVKKGLWDQYVEELIRPYKGKSEFVGTPKKDYSMEFLNREKLVEEQINKEMNNSIPKCPTCGCTKIRRIAFADKAIGIFLFGLYSNDRKYQFQCENPKCKYKW